MRVLFTTQPALSHLHPLVPLAQELARHGHTVAFACASRFCAAVEASGFQCFPAGMDWLISDGEAVFPRLADARAGRDPAFTMLRDVFAGVTAERTVPDLLRLCRSWQPQLIVRDPQEFGGCVAAERLGIPHASGRENRFLSPARWRHFTEPMISHLRRAHELDDDPGMHMLYRYLAFAWVPRRFIEAVPEISPSSPFGTFIAPVMHLIRPQAFDASGHESLPTWVADMPERPTVYATLGTVFNQNAPIFKAIIGALRDENLNVIVTVGRDMHPAEFGALPPHIHVERYIPQTLLAPYCDVVLTAGGFGTVMSALHDGLPLVVIPVGADQPLNARRCAVLGVGRAIAADQRTPESIRDAVLGVLGDATYRRNARRFSEDMRALPDAAYAVALLERLATERMPLPAP